MTDIWTVLGIGFLTLMLTLILRSVKHELALVVQIAGISLIALLLLGGISVIKSEIEAIFPLGGISTDILRICFKAMGICFITSASSSLCRDFGQTALSTNIETAGKVTVVILSLPLIKSITATALELIG